PIIGGSVSAVGHGVAKLGKSVIGGMKKVGGGVDDRLRTTGGFAADESQNPESSDQDRAGDGIGPGYRLQNLDGDETRASGNAQNARERNAGRPSFDGEGPPATDGSAD